MEIERNVFLAIVRITSKDSRQKFQPYSMQLNSSFYFCDTFGKLGNNDRDLLLFLWGLGLSVNQLSPQDHDLVVARLAFIVELQQDCLRNQMENIDVEIQRQSRRSRFCLRLKVRGETKFTHHTLVSCSPFFKLSLSRDMLTSLHFSSILTNHSAITEISVFHSSKVTVSGRSSLSCSAS